MPGKMPFGSLTAAHGFRRSRAIFPSAQRRASVLAGTDAAIGSRSWTLALFLASMNAKMPCAEEIAIINLAVTVTVKIPAPVAPTDHLRRNIGSTAHEGRHTSVSETDAFTPLQSSSSRKVGPRRHTCQQPATARRALGDWRRQPFATHSGRGRRACMQRVAASGGETGDGRIWPPPTRRDDDRLQVPGVECVLHMLGDPPAVQRPSGGFVRRAPLCFSSVRLLQPALCVQLSLRLLQPGAGGGRGRIKARVQRDTWRGRAARWSLLPGVSSCHRRCGA